MNFNFNFITEYFKKRTWKWTKGWVIDSTKDKQFRVNSKQQIGLQK